MILQIVCLMFTLLGIFWYIYSIPSIMAVWKITKSKGLKIWWVVLFVLIIFFMSAFTYYLLFLLFLVQNITIIEVIVSQIIFWSGFFSVVCFKIFYETINENIKIKRDLLNSLMRFQKDIGKGI
ncbi:MAG: hypothetical protein ABIA04_04260 [Pseudomonadota bacterium]